MFRIQIPVRHYWKLLSGYLLPQKARVIGLAFLIGGGIVLQLVHPQILRYFIDTASAGGALQNLISAAILFIGIALVQQAVNVASVYFGENIGWTATNAMRGDLASHCLKLDMSFHKSHTAGELIERIDGDVNSLANFFSNFVVVLMSNLLLLIGILGLLYMEDWRVGLGLTGFVAIALVTIQKIRSFAVPFWTKVRQMSARFYGFLGEHLEGTEDTRSNGATPYVMRRFLLLLREWVPARVKAAMGSAAMWISTLLVFTIGNAITFVLCAYLWKSGKLTLGAIYMIFYYTELLIKPIERIRTQLEDLQKADASIHRIRELFAVTSKIKDGDRELPEGALSVELDSVSFGYIEEEQILRRVSFQLEAGRTLAILGRTGSGKTTIARLLIRFYEAQQGTVRLGDVPVTDVRLHDLRRRIGAVTQDVQIFQGTVRDNLTFFDRSISDSAMIDIIREVGLGDWFSALPDGLDSSLDTGGSGLSAGEAQLLALARVFLTDPGLVILDEASSRLDPATESQLEKAISKLLQGRTAILIAHRLTTVQRADQIVIMERGQVLEYGDKEWLMRDHTSHYYQLLVAGKMEVTA
ncbi:ABC transporter ATP-binding protein [Paenibacillus sp. J2TS4]|uniref:ABC transporter ATP-binding protein n=1 Tax=Paenibacillus sp. J2TS4 TaxID=2807194 RepID=UPI001B1CA20B|nr:ABC transporter ATP-binding protein [Paenibacillus sp. J2TS4]GIP34418.1 helicase [Paenibacillus sp. J2TS4]